MRDTRSTDLRIYDLLGEPAKFAMYIHGDGHDTIDDVRRLAYDWIESSYNRSTA